MTMPHLMNCAHSSDSWCLECVKAERERYDAEIADAQLAVLADVLSFTRSMLQSVPCKCSFVKTDKKVCKRCRLLGYKHPNYTGV